MSDLITRAEKIAKVRDLLAAGLRPLEVAREMCISQSHMYRLLAEGRERGEIPPSQNNPLVRIKSGAIGPLVNHQDIGFRKWLAKNIPEGTTIASFAVACLLDTYYDETDQ